MDKIEKKGVAYRPLFEGVRHDEEEGRAEPDVREVEGRADQM